MTFPTRQLGHPPGDLVTHLNPDPTGRRPPGCHHRCASFRLNGAVSLVPLLGIRRRGEDGKTVGRSTEWQGWWRWWWVDMRRGCHDSATTRLHGDGSRSREEDNEKGETEDRLGPLTQARWRTPAC
jgi:hypothetical protein